MDTNVDDEATLPRRRFTVFSEPTETWQGPQQPVQQTIAPPVPLPPRMVQPKRSTSRRRVIGAAILGTLGLGAAATAGGLLVEGMLQNGGLGGLFHGTMADSVEI